MIDKTIAKVAEKWVFNPAKFVEDVIKWEEEEKITSQQLEGFRWVGRLAEAKYKVKMGLKVTEEEKKLASKLGISIRSGHGVGKTAFLAMVYYWLLTCFPRSVGYVTAPTADQLENVLWRQFSIWRRRSPLLNINFEIQSDKIYYKNVKEGKSEWFVNARTTNIKATEEEQAETLSGQHSEYMILAADEASAIPAGIFKPLEGALTGLVNFIILIGNPTRSKGYFFDTFHRDSDRWICLHWNSEESPLVHKEDLERDIKKYGRDSNWYRIRRRGEFPIQDATTFIPYDWVMDSVNREIENTDTDFVLKGIDIGAGIDESVILTRVGHRVTDIVTKNEPDTEILKSWILNELTEETRPFIVFVDPVGVGTHIYYWLSGLNIENMETVYAVDVRETSHDSTCFRLRDELFYKVRCDFENRTISLPDDEELTSELTTMKSDDPDSTKGKLKIESKRDMRKRGLHSPNKADALALTYYMDDNFYSTIIKSSYSKRKKEKPLNWKVI